MVKASGINRIKEENLKALAGLRWQWRGYAMAGIVFYAVGFLFLAREWKIEYAWRWLGLSLIVFGYILRTVWLNLGENRREGEEHLLPGLGAGNLVSLMRGALIAALYGFLFAPLPEGRIAWLPGLLYTVAILSDYVDGALARLTDHVTQLGKVLDMYFDGLGMLVVTALLVQYGKVPAWYLLIGLARYLFLFGMCLRERLGKVNHPLPVSVRRRGMAALQMGFVAVVLLPIFSPPGTHVIAYAFGFPLLVGFLWDWFYVSGVITLDLPKRYVSLEDFILQWIPVGLRLAVLACALLGLLATPEQNPLHLAGWIVIGLIITGAAVRIASIAGLVILGLAQNSTPLSAAQLALGILFSLVLLLGSGKFSLWKPEDSLIYKRVGEKTQSKT